MSYLNSIIHAFNSSSRWMNSARLGTRSCPMLRMLSDALQYQSMHILTDVTTSLRFKIERIAYISWFAIVKWKSTPHEFSQSYPHKNPNLSLAAYLSSTPLEPAPKPPFSLLCNKTHKKTVISLPAGANLSQNSSLSAPA